MQNKYNMLSPTTSKSSDTGALGLNSFETPPRPRNRKSFEFYDLSPPKGEHARDCDTALKKLKRDGFKAEYDASGEPTDKTKILVFLYGRGFLRGKENKRKRKKRISRMVNDPSSSRRLLDVLHADGDLDLSSDENFRAKYIDFCLTLKRYFQDPLSFGFAKKVDDIDLFLRFQRHGTCYLLAPSVQLAYILQLLGAKGASPIDVSRYIRHSFSDDELYDYATHDEGGYSGEVLEHLLNHFVVFAEGDKEDGPDTIHKISELFHGSDDTVLESTLKHGPCLLSNFAATRTFTNTAKLGSEGPGYWRFDGNAKKSKGSFHKDNGQNEEDALRSELEDALDKNSQTTAGLGGPNMELQEILHAVEGGLTNINEAEEEEEATREEEATKDGVTSQAESHAMLLLGGRREESGKLWLLFQNWWYDMPLVEMSFKYLKSAGGTFYCVPGLASRRVRTISSPIQTNKCLVADCHNLDKQDHIGSYEPVSHPVRDRISFD